MSISVKFDISSKSINKIVLKQVDGIVVSSDSIFYLNNKSNDFINVLELINEEYASLSLQFK